MSEVFVPKEIHVGFQKRDDTYTGKLAYVTYLDEKNVLRKKTSWEQWRDSKMDPLVTPNEPTSGFVMNKRAGGYRSHYDMRQSYVRVYDPRGFEFEMTIPNLVYVLENVTSTKGKGLEGDFVYGWSGTELLLIPVDAPDYAEMIARRDTIYGRNSFKAADMVLGGTYKTRGGKSLVYMGRFQAYTHSWRGSVGEARGKLHFFYDQSAKYIGHAFTATSSLSNLVAVVDATPVPDYAELFEKLEHQDIFSPHDPSRDVLVPFTLEEFQKDKQTPKTNSPYQYGRGWNTPFYSGGKVRRVYYDTNRYWNGHGYETASPRAPIVVDPYYEHGGSDRQRFTTLEEAFIALQPQHKDTYLANGQFYRREV